MIKKVLLGLAALFPVGIASFASIVAPYMAPPTFNVNNSSGEPVQVTAYWREKNRNLGEIAPGQKVEFEVNDEAAISFKARYPNGKELRSREIYFTTGITIQAEVTELGIEVNYDPST